MPRLKNMQPGEGSGEALRLADSIRRRKIPVPGRNINPLVVYYRVRQPTEPRATAGLDRSLIFLGGTTGVTARYDMNRWVLVTTPVCARDDSRPLVGGGFEYPASTS